MKFYKPSILTLVLLVSQGSVTRFFRDGEKYYIYFVDSLSSYPTAKEFS